MEDRSDQDLLQAFAEHGDEQAFAELVRRWGSLIFGVARRHCADRLLAEEAAQNVLTVMARRSGELAGHPALAAWLHKTAHHEARRAAEKESNRRRYMHRYAEDRAGGLSVVAADPAWREALPELDAALASLPERDRSIVLSRYVRTQPYRVIAETAGLTVAACEKRAERALEKMSRFLRRRGVSLSAATLSAGLTSAMTEAEAALPAALMARLTGGALSTAAQSPANPSWSVNDLVMMKTKVASWALPAVMVVLSGLGGFAAARTLKIGPPRSGGETSAGGFNSTSALRPPPPLVSSRGPHAESLSALLKAAQRDLATANLDPLAAARASSRLAVIESGDVHAALALAEEMIAQSGDSSALLELVYQRWAEFEPREACESAHARVQKEFLRMPALAAPLKIWAAKDPRAAFEWYSSMAAAKNPNEQTDQRWRPISSLRWIMGAWVMQDAKAAAEAFRSLRDPREIQGALTGVAELSGAAPGRLLILEAWSEMNKDNRHAWSDINNLLRQWSAHRPGELAAWLDRSGVEKTYHDSVAKPILSGWLREKPEDAIQWWFTAPGGYPERSHRMGTLVEAWIEADIFAAAEWLASQPLDESAGPSMASLASGLVRSDPERAWQWALQVPESPHRRSALCQVAANWAQTDKEAVQAAINASNLDEATATAVRDALPKP